MESTFVMVKVLTGFLANVTENIHRAHKFTQNGITTYEVWYGGYRVFLSPEKVEEIAPIETYWFVKEVSTATETNPSFAGEVHVQISGKGGQAIFVETPDGFYNKDWTMYASDIIEYGYKRFCDAKRSYNYKHPQNDEYWKTTVKIVSFDVQKDANGVYHVV